MSYPTRTAYKGVTILEHDPASSGYRFQIEYSPGNFSGLFQTFEEVKRNIDYQEANGGKTRTDGGRDVAKTGSAARKPWRKVSPG